MDATVGKTSFHVAIIMDGNGRWAQQRQKNRIQGHEQGAEALRAIVKACPAMSIRYLTVYAFSCENWKRPHSEVAFLMELFEKYLEQEASSLHKDGVCVRIIGQKEYLAPSLKMRIAQVEELTQNNTHLALQIALNYGGRKEIVSAVRGLAEKVRLGLLKPEEIYEEHISSGLWTRAVPDPDLMIRTGGEMRLSNYLLWQLSYSELFFSQKFWPDFTPDDLQNALSHFRLRTRRFGTLDGAQ